MSTTDRIAIFLSLLAVVAGYLVHENIFEGMAHLEDEMAYVWQSQAIARGNIKLPEPPGERSFLVPFVVDYNGTRFGKYPLGWPLVLAISEILHVRYLVNPLLGGLGIWLTYLLGRRLFSSTVALLASGLTLASPFFLVNTGSLLSHPLGLVLSAGFVLFWLSAFGPGESRAGWKSAVGAALCLGALGMTRPLTALAVGLPFSLHGIHLFIMGNGKIRRNLLMVAGILSVFILLHFAWQFYLTGDPFLNPYTLWWEYDRIGFGPGHGRRPEGHTLRQAWINTRNSLRVGNQDLFGWLGFSWIFIPFGLFASLREKNWRALLAASVYPSLVLVYLAYWIGSSLFGPRYFYEGLYGFTIMSAAGIAWLAGWPLRRDDPWPVYEGWRRVRPLAVTALLTALVVFNLFAYLPPRLDRMRGLYGVSRSHLEPFLTEGAQELAPALVIVHPQKKWIEYGTLIELQNPYLDTPFIFIITRGPQVDQEVAREFPNRAVFHYYQDQPYTLYTAPRP
ncbi:MAG: ArnT family glycosyltransferase [Anaerolineales bacterium]